METPLLRWTKGKESFYALSILQPWAWLIVNGFKNVENRTWATRHSGPLLIHAGANRRWFNEDSESVLRNYGVLVPEEVEFGGIVGLVELAGCKDTSRSRWHVDGKVGWVLKNPGRLPFRPVKGQQRLFRPRFD